ncbi:acetyl-CoA carboxylase biotin carboxyl carrier protein [Aurantibacillus circumpalustris]|uniref:acetyl-CoA carboxylase biotin carboxyl carrier protein n=1 Tax=Aurantibacillus circumpalustris TaxID=3036359 RepID=UPI00295BA82E|nr:acetyl-CoA carboxylase biotin carboxyl carrier protein [Aurantibacillus circumpalustris]
MKLTEIQDLIKFVSKSGVSEVELETKEIKIVIRTPKSGQPVLMQQAPVMAAPMAVAPVAQAVTAPANAGGEAKSNGSANSDEAKYVTIKSPMIGTFYRSAGPDKAAFVGVGDEITAGKPVCIIEAMKLFNEIESDIKGKIVKVLVDDATPVEYDQPLFLVDPS